MNINGRDIALTKLQVFDGVGEIKICDSYTYNGPRYFYAGRWIEGGASFTTAPSDVDVLRHCEPNYISLPGWDGPTQDIDRYDNLPREMKNYVRKVCNLTGARAGVLSMGPERSQTIVI